MQIENLLDSIAVISRSAVRARILSDLCADNWKYVCWVLSDSAVNI